MDTAGGEAALARPDGGGRMWTRTHENDPSSQAEGGPVARLRRRKENATVTVVSSSHGRVAGSESQGRRRRDSKKQAPSCHLLTVFPWAGFIGFSKPRSPHLQDGNNHGHFYPVFSS